MTEPHLERQQAILAALREFRLELVVPARRGWLWRITHRRHAQLVPRLRVVRVDPEKIQHSPR